MSKRPVLPKQTKIEMMEHIYEFIVEQEATEDYKKFFGHSLAGFDCDMERLEVILSTLNPTVKELKHMFDYILYYELKDHQTVKRKTHDYREELRKYYKPTKAELRTRKLIEEGYLDNVQINILPK